MSHGSDDSENYWPGYVDALTSMVQVLAFVMMMLAMAVFVLSQSVAKHAVEAIAKVINAEVDPKADVKTMTQAVMDQVQKLQSAAAGGEAHKAEPSPATKAAATAESEKISGMRVAGGRSTSDNTRIQVDPAAPRLTVNFEERSFRVQPDGAASITNLVDERKIAERGQLVIINAYAYSGDGALSEARRLAYYRAMMARKQLVDAKVRPDSIRVNVTDTSDKQKGMTIDMVVADKSAS
ncbi:MAG: hypothetical protein ABWY18_12660 [Tardiphaga sp.]